MLLPNRRSIRTHRATPVVHNAGGAATYPLHPCGKRQPAVTALHTDAANPRPWWPRGAAPALPPRWLPHSGSRCLRASEIPKISAVSLQDIAVSSRKKKHHKFCESAAGQTCTYVKSRSPPPHSTPPLNQGERAASAALFLISLYRFPKYSFGLSRVRDIRAPRRQPRFLRGASAYCTS